MDEVWSWPDAAQHFTNLGWHGESVCQSAGRMSAKYQPYAAIAPSETDNAYIFALVPTVENGLAAITSASELLLVNRENLSSSQVVRIQGAPSGTNCLALGDDQGSSVLCSGTDGTVTAFDLRSQNKAFEFKIGIRFCNALSCSTRD